MPGGLPCAVILTCLFYGAISGSGPATTAAVGSMCVPFLTDLGYEKKWSAGLIAVAGGLGVIIPPSIPFVLYSLATGVSTGDLFLGGVFPGILIGLFLMVYAVYYCVRHGEGHDLINARMKELRSAGFLKLFFRQLLGSSVSGNRSWRYLHRLCYTYRGGNTFRLLCNYRFPVHLQIDQR